MISPLPISFLKDEIIWRETKLSTLKLKVARGAVIEWSYTLSLKLYAGRKPLYAKNVRKGLFPSITCFLGSSIEQIFRKLIPCTRYCSRHQGCISGQIISSPYSLGTLTCQYVLTVCLHGVTTEITANLWILTIIEKKHGTQCNYTQFPSGALYRVWNWEVYMRFNLEDNSKIMIKTE